MTPTPVIATSYDPMLVVFSVAIAVFASYTALVVAGRIRATAGVARYLWLLGAGLLMGGGVWSMHFVGMLAFRMPIPVTYDLWLTLLSLLVPVVVTAIGFYIVAAKEAAPSALVLAGGLIGLGIVAMHYTGMAAMRMPTRVDYQPFLVGASVSIAVVASITGLWLAFKVRTAWQKVAGAMALGTAVVGMHYTAMAAAEFTAMRSGSMPTADPTLDPVFLGITIAAAAFVLLFLGLLAALFDRYSVGVEQVSTAVRPREGLPVIVRGFDQYSPKFALLVIILFSVVVVGISWGLTVWRDYNEAMEQAQVATWNTARLVEEHVERAVGEGDLVVRHVIGLINQFGLDRVVSSRPIWESTKAISASLPHLASVEILDAKGDLLFTTQRFPAPEGSSTDRRFFRTRIDDTGDKLLVSDVRTGPDSGETFFNISRRVTGRDGAVAAIIVAEIRTDYFSDFYAGLNLGPNSAVGIFREDGTMLTRQPSPPKGFDTDFSAAPLFRTYLPQSASGTFEGRSWVDGVEHVVSYRRARTLPLVITASIAKDAILAEWRSRLHRNAALGLVIAVTLCALSWLAVRSLQREEVVTRALRRAHDDLDRRVHERTAELETALADKEILFKEVHHRVKNNLQVICSLLNLQSGRFREPAVRQAFDEAYNRVYSISLVHKALYDQNAAAQIDFGSYLRELCGSLSKLYDASARHIVIEVSAAESRLDLNRAVPAALIVNEVISNALKHAFPDRRTGWIKIDFAIQGPDLHLSIRDNGIGIPRNVTQAPAKSLGLVIVNALAQQIDAKISFRREAGTRFDLSIASGAREGDEAVLGVQKRSRNATAVQ